MTRTTSVSVPQYTDEGFLAARSRATRRRRLLLTLAVLWMAALGWHGGWIGPAYAQDEETLEMPAETPSASSTPAPAARQPTNTGTRGPMRPTHRPARAEARIMATAMGMNRTAVL